MTAVLPKKNTHSGDRISLILTGTRGFNKEVNIRRQKKFHEIETLFHSFYPL